MSTLSPRLPSRSFLRTKRLLYTRVLSPVVMALSAYRAWLKIQALKNEQPCFKTRNLRYWENRGAASRRLQNSGLEDREVALAPAYLREDLQSYFASSSRAAKHEVEHSSDKRTDCKDKSNSNMCGQVKDINDAWRQAPDAAESWQSFAGSRALRNSDAHMASLLDLKRSLDGETLATTAGWLAAFVFLDLFGADPATPDSILARRFYSDGQDARDCALTREREQVQEQEQGQGFGQNHRWFVAGATRREEDLVVLRGFEGGPELGRTYVLVAGPSGLPREQGAHGGACWQGRKARFRRALWALEGSSDPVEVLRNTWFSDGQSAWDCANKAAQRATSERDGRGKDKGRGK